MYSILIQSDALRRIDPVWSPVDPAAEYHEQRLASQDLAAAFQEARDWVDTLGGSPVYFLKNGKIIAEVLR